MLLDATGHCPNLSAPDETTAAHRRFLRGSGRCDRECRREAHEACRDRTIPSELYDRAPCGYLSTTPDGMITKVNQTFLTLDRLRRATELVGRRTFVQLLTAGGRIFHETHYAPLLRVHGEAGGIAFDLVRHDGSRLPGADQLGARARRRRHAARRPDRRLRRHRAAGRTNGSCCGPSGGRGRPRRGPRRWRSTLQQVLIPREPPVIDGLELAAAYRPARAGDEVGGDFYDFFETA